MKIILFLAAVYSLIINQCYQKKTVAKAVPSQYIGTIAKNMNPADSLQVQYKPVPAVYIIPASELDYLPRYSVLR